MKVTESYRQMNAGRMMYQTSSWNSTAADKSGPDKTENLPEKRAQEASASITAGKAESSSGKKAGITENDKYSTSETEKSALTPKEKEELEEKQELEALQRLAENIQNSKDGKKSGFNPKSSSPDESVGQLAALLARSETRFDVLQVSSKAMRALTNLKMSLAAADKDEAKKIAVKIKRMEKLIKRIQKKLQHLGKEEQLELQKQRAQKRQELQKVKDISKELQARRKKRRREERNYAFKELSKDQKEENGEMLSNAFGSDGSLSPDLSSMIETGGMDLSAAMEGVSIDVTA